MVYLIISSIICLSCAFEGAPAAIVIAISFMLFCFYSCKVMQPFYINQIGILYDIIGNFYIFA